MSTTQHHEEVFSSWRASCLNNDDGSIDLRKEARSFFQSLVVEEVVEEVPGQPPSLRTTGTADSSSSRVVGHEEALAALILRFGGGEPSLQNSSKTRLRAAEAVLGSLEGCSASDARISSELVTKVGEFLLVRCGPLLKKEPGEDMVVDDDDDDLLEDEIRDAAVSALVALVSLCPSSPAATADNLVDAVRARIQLAKRGVESRCSRTDDDNDDGDDEIMGDDGGGRGMYGEEDYGGSPPPQPVQAGLSMLPRSKRSLCFDLLRSGVDSVSSILTSSDDTMVKEAAAKNKRLQEQIRDFVVFTTKCLHGESDPRCLMQLLRLFRAECESFRPLMANATAPNNFPIVEMFDATAPYYPVQFTPPPNDPHGITKPGIRRALLDVLGYTGYDDDDVAAASADDSKETMLQLSLGLVMERLMPLPDEAPTNMTEKREALEDISSLLFPRSEGDGSQQTRRVEHSLSVDSIRQLSNGLLTVHHETSAEVSKGGQERLVAKDAADLCRILVAKIALGCELAASSNNNSSLWESFVADPMKSLSSAVVSAPSQGRASVAYMACLTSCGEPKTIRLGLELGLAVLLDGLQTKAGQQQGGGNEDDVATAIYGVGAFFSASRTGLIHAQKRGIALSPHPLQPYSARAVEVLNGYLVNNQEDANNINISLKIAAIRAMESVLLASPASNFDNNDDDGGGWSTFLHSIFDPLHVNSMSSLDDDADLEWLQACSQTAGCILAHSVIDEEESKGGGGTEQQEPSKENNNNNSILESDYFRSRVQEEFLPTLLSSAMTPAAAARQDIPRYDWKALATACSFGERYAASSSRIVSALAQSLRNALDHNRADKARSCAKVLNLLFRKKGASSSSQASAAYHNLSATSLDIIESLYLFGTRGPGLPQKGTTGGIESTFGTSMLELPPSEEDRANLKATMDGLYRIVSMLRPAYQTTLSLEQLKRLTVYASNALPPLAQADAIKLAISLPLLSAALASLTSPVNKNETLPLEGDKMKSLVTDLAEFSLSPEHYERSRSHGLLCLQLLLSSYTSEVAKCPCRSIISDMLAPVLKTAVEQVKAGGELEKDPRGHGPRGPSIGECFSLLSVLGSGAACRGGGLSNKTADEVALFFVDLACTYRGTISFEEEGEVIEVNFSGSEHADKVALAAASSLGSILSTESDNSLWKQRLAHKASKHLQGFAGPIMMSASSPAPIGVVACACYITCTCNLKVIGSTNLNMLALIVARGLSGPIVQNENTPITKLVLAALLKLLAVAPATLSGNATYLAIGIMRAFASSPEPTSGIAVKLLALQALESLALADSHLTQLSDVKPAVVSILAAAMNHPSSVLRQAAVEVRNAWYVGGEM